MSKKCSPLELEFRINQTKLIVKNKFIDFI